MGGGGVVTATARSIEAIAVDVLKCAISWESGVCLVGNVTAREIAVLAAHQIDTCPKCGATAWVNIDCDLCGVVGAIVEDAS